MRGDIPIGEPWKKTPGLGDLPAAINKHSDKVVVIGGLIILILSSYAMYIYV